MMEWIIIFSFIAWTGIIILLLKKFFMQWTQKTFLESKLEMEKVYQQTQQIGTRLEEGLYLNRQELQQGLFQGLSRLENKIYLLEKEFVQQSLDLRSSVEAQLHQNLKEGFTQFEKIQSTLHQANLQFNEIKNVQDALCDLNQLLKIPHLRGSFGEAELEKVLSDFLSRQAFLLQYQIMPHSTDRVDAVVRHQALWLPIDSKFPREQILPLFHTSFDESLKIARKQLYTWVRAQAKSIALKYIHPEYGTTDFAFLFLPSETIYFEVLRNIEAIQYMSKYRVFPVSPNTLAMSLHTIQKTQETYEMTKNITKTLEDLKKAQKHFEYFEKRLLDIFKYLRKAQESYEISYAHLQDYQNMIFRLTAPVGDRHAEEPHTYEVK